MYTTNQKTKVLIIGGGAAGLLAAIAAAENFADVTVFEKNEKLGRKLRITGKGRCNVTNNCEINEFLQNVPTNPRFLYSSLHRLDPSDTMALFERIGVPLKTERGRRVFPISDNANDIADALRRECLRLGVTFKREKIVDIKAENNKIVGVVSAKEEYSADSVIIATGGISYPRTGSDGDGHRFAQSLGHSITELKPSLVPLVAGGICAECQGLSLRNIGFSVEDTNGKCVYRDFGELMFTHFGLTGPVVLSASAHIPDLAPGKYTAVIDLKPALDEKQLDARLLSDFSKYINKDFCNSLSDLLPQKLIAPIVRLSGIDERTKVNEITKAQRQALARLIKGLRIPLKSHRPIDEAIITKGGVSIKEINPKTMESKLIDGLFFAGEIIDVDAYTGGYNLQIAFSTGALAGESAAQKIYTEN